MSDLDLTPWLRKKMVNYPRKRGRYNSSELYGITKKYVTPKTWLYPKEKDIPGILRMWNGILVHDHIQRLLPAEDNEVKVEHHHFITPDQSITLVAKVDHLPKHVNEIWEFKSSDDLYPESSESHNYQAKLYCTIFKRPLTKIFQPVSNERGLFLKHIGTVGRDDDWFAEQMKKLEEFHLKLEELWEIKELGLDDQSSY